MFRYLFILVALFCGISVHANEKRIAELEQQLGSLSEADSASISVLLELANLYLYTKPELAEQYALKVVPLTIAERDDYNRALAFRLLGMASIYQGKNDEAFTFLTQAMNAASITDDPHLLSISNRSLGVLYELTVDYDSAMKFYIEAIKYAKLSDKPADLAMVYNNLGNVLNSQGDYEEAVNYFQKSAAIHRQINNFAMEMNVTVGLGMSYLKLQDFEQAQQLFEAVLANREQIYDFTYSEASVSLAHIYQERGMYEKAIDTYNYIINDSRAGSYPQALASAYLGLAKLYTSFERFEEALSLYRQGIVKVKNKTSVESEIELYENWANLEIQLGNYEEAANVQAEYIDRRNAIQPVTQVGIIKRLESQLKTERDLIRLQEDLLQRERDARHSSIYLFAAVVISLVCLILFLALMLRKQKLMRLEQANETLVVASETDYLTGVGNRRYLDRKLAVKLGKSIDTAFLLLDVDYFKQLNDAHGHDVGDNVLISLAKVIKSLCRKDDIIARIGGEEFVILLFDTDKKAALAFAERVRQSVQEMTFASESNITASIGVATGNMEHANYDELYKKADLALYEAKSDGRNRVKEYKAQATPSVT